MNLIDLLTERIGWTWHKGHGRPIRRIRSYTLDALWDAIKAPYLDAKALRYRWRVRHVPDEWITEPIRMDGIMQRITISIGEVVTVVEIVNWAMKKEDAAWFGPPKIVSYSFIGAENAVEVFRESARQASAEKVAHA